MANNGEIFDGPKEIRPGHGYRKFRYCVRRGQGGRHRDIFVWIDEHADESIVTSAGRAELQRTLDQGYTPMRIFIDSDGETTWVAPPWWTGRIISLALVLLIGLAGGWLAKQIGHGTLPSVSAPLIGAGGAVILIYAVTTFMKLTVRSSFKYTRRQRLRTAPPLRHQNQDRGRPGDRLLTIRTRPENSAAAGCAGRERISRRVLSCTRACQAAGTSSLPLRRCQTCLIGPFLLHTGNTAAYRHRTATLPVDDLGR